MSNELIIDVTPSHISIALLEDKKLVELHKEESNLKFAVGDIYLGTIKKIMPGLNAAFVDVGYERDAFLHYLDLGPQFSSLSKYLEQIFNRSKTKVIPFSKFKMIPDIDKNGKIPQVINPGQKVLVQVAKEPISTKGPRLTSEISIAGRNLVLMPFGDKVSVSQKLGSAEEKKRLKTLIQSIRPKNYGVIIRTAAEGKKVAVLDAELRSLVKQWENSLERLKTIKPPKLVLGELDRTSAMLRDILNVSFSNIYVNDEKVYNEVKDYIEKIAPEKHKIVKHYKRRQPIFEYFGIEKQIKSSFGRTVSFKNGAYLIIEHTEALHVIDVNSGNRSKSDTDQETNAVEVNLAAAEEISRQLRLRDMGGIIVVDFIDMHQNDHKQKLYEHIKEKMLADRTKHNILPLSKFGLMQITRQRVRPEMHINTAEKCPTCEGTGKIASSIMFIEIIENSVKQAIEDYHLNRIELKVHPYIQAYVTQGFKSIRRQWQKKMKCKIAVTKATNYSFMEYHMFTKEGEEILL